MAQAPRPTGPLPRGGPPSGAEFAGIGIQFAAGILLFVFLGSWADKQLGTSPWLLLLGVLGGFALSTLWIYRRLVIRPRERAREGKE